MSTIAVVGLDGVGKTTLCKSISFSNRSKIYSTRRLTRYRSCTSTDTVLYVQDTPLSRISNPDTFTDVKLILFVIHERECDSTQEQFDAKHDIVIRPLIESKLPICIVYNIISKNIFKLFELEQHHNIFTTCCAINLDLCNNYTLWKFVTNTISSISV